MRYIALLYSLSAQASLLSFIAATIWGGVLTVYNKPCKTTYKLMLIATHITTALSSLLLITLSLTGVFPDAALSLIYSFIAFTLLPCVYIYLPKDQPHHQVWGITLSCLFACGMVLRSLQVLQGVTDGIY